MHELSDKVPLLAVDAVIHDEEGIILIKRRNPPFKGMWALPGGFVEYGESVEDAVKREVDEETGLRVEVERLLGVYSKPGRDPRGHTVSVVFICRKTGGILKAGSDAKEAGEFSLKKLPELAFDHREILDDLRYRAHPE